MADIRWKQRFNNYSKAFQTLTAAVELAHSRELSELEKQGLIQSFEFTPTDMENRTKAWEHMLGILGERMKNVASKTT